MNEKITNQIERMKEQTIGVEVEMNNIARSDAAKLAAIFLVPVGTKILQTATDIKLGALGMHMGASGSFSETPAFMGWIARGAKW